MNTLTEIIFTTMPGNNGDLGLITLNRPQALNAVTPEMFSRLYQQLQQWATDATIKAIVIQGAGEKAFSAGGDIRKIFTLGKADFLTAAAVFWHEYRLNQFIYHYPKPYISLLDGITMGAGVGISQYGSHRVATERLTFAMPETGIGFFPDVGGSYFLSRLPEQIGIYLGLTGARIKAADALALGLIDCCVPSTQLTEIVNAIAAANFADNADTAINLALQPFAIDAGVATLTEQRKPIAACFQFNHVEKIIAALEQNSAEWCQHTAKILLSKPPTSLKVTLQQLRNGAQLQFDQCMQMEYRLAYHFLQGHDFYEGVRAAIIDKDQSPKWQPAHLTDVSEKAVADYFAPLTPQPELNF